MRPALFLAAIFGLLILGSPPASSQDVPQKELPFKWVNEFPKDKFPGLRHGTFQSQSMNVKVGYCIYLPPGYDEPENKARRYPVVYWLHGGRPGGETKVISLTPFFDNAIKKGQVPPVIYVFPNGGIVSHYDYPKLKSLGETAFIKELIPHIDATYRTVASRNGRAVEGFSQGGRGTARYLFKYPDLFCSAAPMGGGHQHEKRIAENNGDEGMYQFEPGNNTYDLAKKYAAEAKQSVRILVVVGTKDMNYQANLDWMDHLRSLKIPFEKQIIEDVSHNTQMVYEKAGLEVMKFHADNFKKLEPKIGEPERLKLWNGGAPIGDGKFEQADARITIHKPEKPNKREAPPPTHRDVKYGPHERNVLDFWQAESKGPTPVLVSIHDGGFYTGEKNVPLGLLKQCLDSGISVVAITYRYSSHAIAPAAFYDSARAIQFIRSKAKDWNIDPKRIASSGASAGAGLSLWLGFHDDMAEPMSNDPIRRESTRLTCIIGFDGQTSCDPRFIKKLFPGKDVYKHHALSKLYGVDLDKLDGLPAEKYKLFEEVSALPHLTKDDPPVLLFYSRPLDAEVTDQFVGIHHALFGKALKEKMDDLKIPCEVVAKGTRLGGGNPTNTIDFLKEHFGMKK